MAIETQRAERIAAWAGIALLVLGSFFVLRPFYSGLFFALILAISTWPAYTRLERLLNGRVTLAAALATTGLVAVLLIPLLAIGFALADDAVRFVSALRGVVENPPPAPPWISDIPLVGTQIMSTWDAVLDGTLNIAEIVAPFAERVGGAVLSGTGALGGEAIQLAIGIMIAFFLFRHGDEIYARLRVVGRRIAGPRAEHLLREAHGTMTGVLYGIVGTAIAQGTLCAVGLAIAGIPGPLFLGLMAAILSIIPGGVALVMWGAALWLLFDNQILWAVFLVIWGIVPVGMVETFIKAGFVSQSSRLPFVLILLGLLGGIAAGGFTGIFWGPTVLAVSYTLIIEWTNPPESDGKEKAADEDDSGLIPALNDPEL